MREKEIWKLGAVYFMFGFSYIIYMTFFVAYLTGEGGLTPQKAGWIFAVMGLFSIVQRCTCGWISDRAWQKVRFPACVSHPCPGQSYLCVVEEYAWLLTLPLSFSGLSCLLYRRLWLQRLEIQWEVSSRLPVLDSLRSFLASANLLGLLSLGG